MKLTGRDYVVGAIVGMSLLVRFITMAVIFMQKSCAQVAGEVQAVVMAYELNPVATEVLKQTEFVNVAAGVLVVPAMIVAIYILLRKVFKGEKEVYLDFLILTLFFSLLGNVANDLGALVGWLM